MVRNWDIIRAILCRLEAAETANTWLHAREIADFDEQEVAYNMRLLKEAGYIDATIMNLSDGSGSIGLAVARRLTNSGHDLLDTIRSETIWSRVKDYFKNKGVDMTFEMVIAVGKTITERILLAG